MAKNEETEPQAELEDGPGVEGQIQYPEHEVDAERAAGFAGGKYDTLEPEEDEEDSEEDST